MLILIKMILKKRRGAIFGASWPVPKENHFWPARVKESSSQSIVFVVFLLCRWFQLLSVCLDFGFSKESNSKNKKSTSKLREDSSVCSDLLYVRERYRRFH